jgi:serine/threonine-protein kinase
MEYLYGEELRNTLKREGVIPPERLVRMVSQAAIALDEAHARKLVHRDLKPDNLFLCQAREGDTVKILDFGSVKDKADNAKKLTIMGTTIGSPYYMSPEQAQGLDTLDQRADVWALAAISYECVTGQVPFKGVNGPSILLEILTKEPAPPSRAGATRKYPVPPTLDTVLGQGLKKQAALRIASAGAFADALGAAYGLDGSHHDWAQAPQGYLGSAMAARLPELMCAAPAVVASGPRPVEVIDDPFAALAGPRPTAPMAPAPYPQAPTRAAGPFPDEGVALAVPTSSTGLVLGLVIGGVVVLLIVAAIVVAVL